MSNVERRVTAILSARDEGYARAMERAAGAADDLKGSVTGADTSAKSFKETTLGMAAGIAVTKLLAKAFDMVKGSIGAAMDRADTMDNFKRSVTLMTGSVATAETTLGVLNSQVRGTAYGLNEAAKATQGLITSGIQIKDSTRYIGGWLDAVSVYGDGTNQTLSNVTFQLSQMAAKGKANLGDLKSAMEAGIPVIQLYAEATGQSTEAVSDAISKGEISTKDFLDVMDRAFRQGTASFKSIEGAAKSAGGTWRGTFDNMRAATTRGVLSIINSIEDARSQADMPGMRDSVVQFGRTSERVLNAVGKVAGFTAKHFNTLASAGMTAATSFTALKVADDIKRKFISFNKELDTASYLFNRHDSSLKKLAGNTSMAGSALESFYKKQRTGTDIANMYYNALSDKDGKMAIHAAAKRLNIALTETDNNGITKFIKLSDSSKAAILAETGALTVKNILLGVKTKQISLATAAQLLFNKAVSANPIGMIVIGITAAVTAYKAISNAIKKMPNEYKDAAKAAKEFTDGQKSIIDSSKSVRDAIDKTISSSSEQSNEARRLVNRLKELSNQSIDTEQKQWLMAQAVEELNAKYPELNIQLDKTGTAIRGSIDAIEAQIDAMEKAAKQQAMKEVLADLYKQQMELNFAMAQNVSEQEKLEAAGLATTEQIIRGGGAIQKQTEASRELTDGHAALTEELAQVEEQLGMVTSELEITSQAQYESMMAAEEHKRSAEGQAETLAMLSEQYGLTSDQIVQYSERTGESLEEAGATVMSLAEKYGLSTDQIIAMVEAQGVTLEEFAATHEEDLKRAEDAFKSYVEATTTGLDTLEQKSTISLDTYAENLQKNIEATETWSSNVNTLMEAGVSKGMIKELEKLGPAGAAQAAAWVAELEQLNGGTLGEFDSLNKNTQDKVNELKELLSRGMEAAGDATRTSMEAQNYSQMGEWAPNEVAKSIINKTPFVKIESARMARAMAQGIDEGSKSVNFKVAQVQLDKDMNLIVTNVDRAGSELMSDVNRNFTDINRTIMSKSGEAKVLVGDGWRKIHSQVTDYGPRIVQSSEGIAKGMKSPFDAVPGQFKDAGYFAGLGLRDGLSASAGHVYATANAIAANVVATMRSALQVRSPSRLTMRLGEYVGEGLGLGISKSMADVRRTTDALAMAAIPDVKGAISGGKSALSLEEGKVVPAEIGVRFGERTYRGFVENIFGENERATDLELAYMG